MSRNLKVGFSSWDLTQQLIVKSEKTTLLLRAYNLLGNVNVEIQRMAYKDGEFDNGQHLTMPMLSNTEGKSLRDWLIAQYPLTKQELVDLMGETVRDKQEKVNG